MRESEAPGIEFDDLLRQMVEHDELFLPFKILEVADNGGPSAVALVLSREDPSPQAPDRHPEKR